MFNFLEKKNFLDEILSDLVQAFEHIFNSLLIRVICEVFY